ncbi:MAG: acyl-CoA thioesterase [Planctomycetes bacterium]|jgi:acyl-CoA hydrolase|nr:acyl-CoA thioesterase [Planctomycetota bacterium]
MTAAEPPLPARPASLSKVEMTEMVFPNDANPLGNCMGGRVMHWIDICAALSAGRHARTPVVTANVDNIDFHNPIPVGGIVVLLASVNFAGRTSMEVGVKVWQEERSTGNRKHVASAYLTFVSLDPESRTPRPVPPVLPETDDEKRRYQSAQARRAHRLAQRK